MRNRYSIFAFIIILVVVIPSGPVFQDEVEGPSARRVIADDGAPPVISLLSPSNGSIVKPFSMLDLDVTDNVAISHVLYHWDLVANDTLESPYDLFARTSEVGHYLYVYANDTSGTWTKALFYFISDGTQPDVSLTTPTNNSVQLSGTNINATITDIHLTDVFYSWDNLEMLNIWTEPYSTQLITGDGSHTLHIYANDSAGNWIGSNFTFITDDDAPVINLRDLTNGTAVQSGGTVDIDVDDASTMNVLYNWNSDSQNTTWFEPYHAVLPIGETLHTLRVYANDTFGRWQHTVFQFIGDNTPPEILLITPANDSLQHSGIEVNVSITDVHLLSVLFNWDRGINQTWVGIIEIPAGDGAHLLRIIANDSAGNVFYRLYRFEVDDSPPVIQGPDDFEFGGPGYPEIRWAAVDSNPEQYTVFVNGTEMESGFWQSGGLTIEIHELPDHDGWPFTVNYTILLTDALGNAVIDTVIVTILSPVTPVDHPVIDNGLIVFPAMVIAGSTAAAVVFIIYILKREGVIYTK